MGVTWEVAKDFGEEAKATAEFVEGTTYQNSVMGIETFEYFLVYQSTERSDCRPCVLPHFVDI